PASTDLSPLLTLRLPRPMSTLFPYTTLFRSGQGFASSHLQINILPDRYLLRTADIGFAQPLRLQYPITHNAVPPPAEPGKPATTGTVWPKSSASARLR